MDSCKYVHYEVDYPEVSQKPEVEKSLKLNSSAAENITLTPPQVKHFTYVLAQVVLLFQP